MIRPREMARRTAIAALTVVLMVLMAIAILTASSDASDGEGLPTAAQLDMIRYKPPEWAKDKVDECWYLKDRKANSAGWAIKIDGDWVVLPVSSQTDMG